MEPLNELYDKIYLLKILDQSLIKRLNRKMIEIKVRINTVVYSCT